MNNKDLMSMLDDEYIIEAEPKGLVRSKHRKLRFSAAVAAAVACVGLTAITAGAVAVYRGMHNSVDTVYDSQAQQTLESKALIRSEVTSNAHFDITTDAVLTDDYLCRVMLTVVPKDETGKKFIEEVSGDHFRGYGRFVSESGKLIGGKGWSSVNAENGTLEVVSDFALGYNAKSKIGDGSAVLIFEDEPLLADIRIKIKPQKNLESKTVTLENGQKLIISPTELVILSDSYDDFAVTNKSAIKEFSLVWKEGARERFLESIGITPEQDARNEAKDHYGYKWYEKDYIMSGKFYGKDNLGLGGGGVGLFLDGEPEHDSDGNYVSGGGRYAVSIEFGTVLDLDDILGIQYGLDKLMF